MNILEPFKNSYLVILLTIVLSVIFTAFVGDSTKEDYIKSISMTLLTSFLIVGINNLEFKLPEEILTGIAPF
jgi:predicted neutral ceramidase superfamily lipid hydrolase